MLVTKILPGYEPGPVPQWAAEKGGSGMSVQVIQARLLCGRDAPPVAVGVYLDGPERVGRDIYIRLKVGPGAADLTITEARTLCSRLRTAYEAAEALP
jgi:hypothetical protein